MTAATILLEGGDAGDAHGRTESAKNMVLLVL